MADDTFGVVIERLFAVIESRRDGDPGRSYTAELLAGPEARIAQKIGEEAVETVIAALGPEHEAVARESADLLYHLMVLWARRGITPADIGVELARREGVSGHDEKAGRLRPSGPPGPSRKPEVK